VDERDDIQQRMTCFNRQLKSLGLTKSQSELNRLASIRIDLETQIVTAFVTR
jgi:hypothetical protein